MAWRFAAARAAPPAKGGTRMGGCGEGDGSADEIDALARRATRRAGRGKVNLPAAAAGKGDGQRLVILKFIRADVHDGVVVAVAVNLARVAVEVGGLADGAVCAFVNGGRGGFEAQV